jgi:hypothetical protein
MTVCPVAIAVGCKKCPVFSVCPLKTILGDQPKTPVSPPDPTPAARGQTSKQKAKSRK